LAAAKYKAKAVYKQMQCSRIRIFHIRT